MSVLWFVFLYYAWSKGLEMSDTVVLMISIFYVGDCILIKKRKRIE